MEPVRVLNLFTIMNRGGAETMVMNYYRHINRAKVQFDFLVHRKQKGAYEDEITKLGGRIYRMCPVYPQNFSRYKRMVREFFDEHPEYQIIHSHMSELGYFVFKEAARRGIPVLVCHAHGSPSGWDFKMFFRTYFKMKMHKFTTHMFACGMEAGDWLFGQRKRNKIYIVNNAIDINKFRYRDETRESIRKELGVTDQFVIGNVANFSKPKNHAFLIEIFAEVSKKRKDAVLMLAGDGALKNRIMEKVRSMHLQEKVLFLGTRDDIAEIIQAMDVFLFPSLWEGFPVSMIEAQAVGLPCIISNKITKSCVITEGVTVMDLEQSPEMWANKVMETETDGDRENAYKKVAASGYDIGSNAEWLEQFYIEAV